MKRVRRWIFNGVAAGSLLAFLSLVGFVAVEQPTRGSPAVIFLRFPGAAVWRIWLTDSDIRIYRLSPWPNDSGPCVGIRLRWVGPPGGFQPALFVGPRTERVSGDFYFSSQAIVLNKTRQHIYSRPVALATTAPSWDTPILIGGNVNANLVPASALISLWTGYIPYWSAYWGLGFLPLLWGTNTSRRLFARKKAGVGLCQVCGYDLRATPDRCPECGTAVGSRP